MDYCKECGGEIDQVESLCLDCGADHCGYCGDTVHAETGLCLSGDPDCPNTVDELDREACPTCGSGLHVNGFCFECQEFVD